MIASFLAIRGYGVSTEGARNVANRIDTAHISIEHMQQELEGIALPA